MKNHCFRALSLALSLALTLPLLSACRPATPDPAGSPGPQAPVSITVWTYYNGDQLDAFDHLVDHFNATVGAQKGITVSTENYGSVSDLEQSVLDAAAGRVGAGQVPNIFAAYADTAYAIDRQGLLADLRPYFTDGELSLYVDSYISEGRFTSNSLKIFPIAKSTELFLLDRTDWEPFAAATGAGYEDFSTLEGLTATAQAYYEWTDALTPDVPNDGKAFYGRDSMANYMLVGAMQLGVELFQVEDGAVTLNFDKPTVRKLWDNYYIPFIKGYFAASGRFRSDDLKTGNILAYTGSSSGATFFPREVVDSDTERHPVELAVFPCPQFRDARPYAVQQGAGMVVTNGDEAQVAASVEFLKWFTKNEQNIQFSVGSGYMPVRKSGNDMDVIRAAVPAGMTATMEQLLTAAIQTVQSNTLYTPRAFPGGRDARDILEYAMSNQAADDRALVKEALAEGATLAQATAPFTTDEHFDDWYDRTLSRLEAAVRQS